MSLLTANCRRKVYLAVSSGICARKATLPRERILAYRLITVLGLCIQNNRNAAREGPSHGHRQHAQKLVNFGRAVFGLCERTDRQTDRQMHKQTYSSQYFATLPWQGDNLSSSCVFAIVITKRVITLHALSIAVSASVWCPSVCLSVSLSIVLLHIFNSTHQGAAPGATSIRFGPLCEGRYTC